MQCEYCKKIIKNPRNLRHHISKFHPEKVTPLQFQCPVCPETFSTMKGFSIHVNKKHSDVISPEEFFNKYVHIDCKFCGKKLEYATRYPGDFCSQAHAVSFRNMNDGKELPFDCAICGSKYVSLRHLGHHVSNVHRDVDIEKYYIDHYKKSEDEDKCKWCKKPMKFISLTKGYTDFCYNTNCNVLWYNENNNRHTNAGVNIAKAHSEHPEKVNTKIEYWLNKGYSQEEAEKQLKNRQITFSKEVCIAKHGEEKGLEVWKARQEKWQESINSKSPEELLAINESKRISLESMVRKYGEQLGKEKYEHWVTSSQFISNSSMVFFKKLEDRMGRFDFVYGEKGEHDCETQKYFYDFVDVQNKKVIEYNGDFWHANPIKYKNGDTVTFPNHKTKTVEEIWEKDMMKNALAEKNGYSILVIWESEVIDNEEMIMNKCVEFLNEGNK